MLVFWIVLAVINLIAFGLYMLDDRLRHTGRGGMRPAFLLSLFTIAGGSLGTLAAYLVADLRFRRAPDMSHEEKQQDNLKYRDRLHAVMLLSIHIFLVLFFFGPYYPENRDWLRGLWQMKPVLCVCLGAVNLATFVLFGIDKLFAVLGKRRIPERILLGLSFIGGSAGSWLGMDLFNHKKTHPQFSAGLPMILITHIVLFGIFAFGLI